MSKKCFTWKFHECSVDTGGENTHDSSMCNPDAWKLGLNSLVVELLMGQYKLDVCH